MLLTSLKHRAFAFVTLRVERQHASFSSDERLIFGASRLMPANVVDGYRESTQSWRELLHQLKRPGLSTAPKLAIGDGSLGFWIALQEEYGPVAQQRCSRP